MALKSWWRACALAGASALAACGGGGSATSDAPGPTLTMLAPALEATLVERNDTLTELHWQARVRGMAPDRAYYIGLSGSAGELISDARLATPTEDDLIDVVLTVRTDLPVGTHRSSAEMALCEDAQCQKLLAGPVSTEVVVQVRPNIALATEVALARQGAEPAPAVDVPMTIPPEAGEVRTWVLNPSAELHAELVAGALRITTEQARAGTYELQVGVESVTDPRYRASTRVRYTVTAPPDGEHEMALSTPLLSVDMTDGQTTTRRLRVTKASWSSVPLQVSLLNLSPDDPPIVSVSPLGGDEFDLVFDAAGVRSGVYHRSLLVSGGPFGGAATVQLSIGVDSAVRVAQPTGIVLDAASTPAQARWSSAIEMADGAAVGWHARISAPWLRTVRGDGLTGRDTLELEVETARLPRHPHTHHATLELSVDRAGVMPLQLVFTLTNSVPMLTSSSPGALVGTQGRIQITGATLASSDLVSSGMLSVSGATLRQARFTPDPRYVGNVYLVTLDVDGAVPGTPVVASLATPLLTTSVSVPVRPATVPPSGAAPLPFGLRRPAAWSARQEAWYFSGEQQVWRLGLAGAQWQLSATPLAHVIDVDPMPDETALLAVAGTALFGLDPVTLAPQWTAQLASGYSSLRVPDATPLALRKALGHNTDGNPFVAVRNADGGGGGIASIQLDPWSPGPTYEWQSGRTTSSADADGLPRPYAVVTSAGREANVVQRTGLEDEREIYRTSSRWLAPAHVDPFLAAVPVGRAVLAVSDDGQRFIDGSGQVRGPQLSFATTGSLAPGRTAAGHGLTGDGRFALVYSYKLSGEAAATQSADDPTLTVFDLRDPAVPGVLASLPLPAAVGCGSPRASGETCRHDASVSVDAHARMALVLGPRGAVVLPLPDTVRQAATQRSKALSAPRPPLRRIVLPARTADGTR